MLAIFVFTGSRPIVWEFAALIACLYVPSANAYLGTVGRHHQRICLKMAGQLLWTPAEPALFTESPFSSERNLPAGSYRRRGLAHLRGPTAFGRKNVPCVVRRHQGTYFAVAKGREASFFGWNGNQPKTCNPGLSNGLQVFSSRLCPTDTRGQPHCPQFGRSTPFWVVGRVFFAPGATTPPIALPF